MKARRTLQRISAILCLICAVAYLVASTLIALPLLPPFDEMISVSGLLLDVNNGLLSLSSTLTFLQGAEIAIPCVTLLLPSILLLVGAICFFSSYAGKQGKYAVADVFCILGALVPATVVALLFSQDAFAPQVGLYALIAVGGSSFLILLFTLLSCFAKERKPLQQQLNDDQNLQPLSKIDEIETPSIEVEQIQQTPNDHLSVEQVDKEQQAETASIEVEQMQNLEERLEQPSQELQQLDQTEQLQQQVEQLQEMPSQEETQLIDDAEPSGDAQQEEKQIVTPATQYVPETELSVQSVVNQTYGKYDDELSPDTIAKINKLRILLDTKVITNNEYLALIKAYLK